MIAVVEPATEQVLAEVPRGGAEGERDGDERDLDTERRSVCRLDEVGDRLEVAEREAGAGHDEGERCERSRVRDGSRARLRHRDDDAADPRRKRCDVDGDE